MNKKIFIYLIELADSLDKDGLTFENQVKIIQIILSKVLVELFVKHNEKIMLEEMI